MDNDLFYLGGRRVARLRHEDIPSVAQALVAVVRKRARAGIFRHANIDPVAIQGVGVDTLIRGEDWARIFPFVQEGLFDPRQFPVAQPVTYRDPQIAYNEPLADHADKPLYERIVNTLTPLFPQTFPTRPY